VLKIWIFENEIQYLNITKFFQSHLIQKLLMKFFTGTFGKSSAKGIRRDGKNLLDIIMTTT